jgi:SAM-dependent methyltransferase
MPIDEIAQKVSDRYAKAASRGEQMCGPAGYDMVRLKTFIPEEVLKISYGCGTPAGLETVQAGETVLDIGSGGGIDCFEAARLVGSSGQVIGIDMTDTMLEIARRNAPAVAANLGYVSSNVEFRKGMADALPVNDASIDVIISNCVINLAPDKRRVFGEMFRVAKPGGRFTISDIVADRSVPQYLIHDIDKWGECLSGALPLSEYIAGMAQAGFVGIHVNRSAPWRVIDGIHFLSMTVTGYKLSTIPTVSAIRYATLCGPFSRVVDERGTAYQRGIPHPVGPETGALLSLSPLASHFVLSAEPLWLTRDDPRWSAVYPAQTACVWQGHFALLTGPFLEAADDDEHLYRRGEPMEVCSKTMQVLETPAYAPSFAVINRAGCTVSGEVVSCSPNGGCC